MKWRLDWRRMTVVERDDDGVVIGQWTEYCAHSPLGEFVVARGYVDPSGRRWALLLNGIDLCDRAPDGYKTRDEARVDAEAMVVAARHDAQCDDDEKPCSSCGVRHVPAALWEVGDGELVCGDCTPRARNTLGHGRP